MTLHVEEAVTEPQREVATHVLRGEQALAALGSDLDRLHMETGAPVTARRPWLQTWIDHYRDYEPLVVAVRDASGPLRAAAPLAVMRRRGWCLVVPIGDGPSDAVRFPSVDPIAAGSLAMGVATALHDLAQPWVLMARQLDPESASVAALRTALRWSAVVPGGVSPRLHFQSSRTLRTHVSRNHHQQTRRMRNRLARDGLTPEICHLRRSEDVAQVWPELERICRARDLQLRGSSALDDPCFGPFFRDVVFRHAAAGEVRLTTLRVRDALAAYVLCFQDGDVRRMWSCRLDPALQEYGVGRLANDAALADALDDPRCTSFDWMLGEESYKSSMSNSSCAAADVLACSHLAMWLPVVAAAEARHRLRLARTRDDRVGRLVSSVSPVLRRVDPLTWHVGHTRDRSSRAHSTSSVT